MKEYKDYIVAIYSNGDAISLSHASTLPQAEVRYLVRCQFMDSTFSGNNAYYKNTLYTSAMDRVEGNRMSWEGIECVLEEDEKWDYLRGSWKSMLLKFAITDKTGVTEQDKVYNAAHNGNGFKELMQKVVQLAKHDTHTALRRIETEKKIADAIAKKAAKAEVQ